MALHVPGAATFSSQGQLLVHGVDRFEEGSSIGLVLLGFGVDGGGEHRHNEYLRAVHDMRAPDVGRIGP
jgi:hypothetical protein